VSLIKNDDNYKNILQVKIQKEFKVTPHYMEVEEHNIETGYYMGVYLCLGQPIHGVSPHKSIPLNNFQSYGDIHQYMSMHGKVFVFLGEGKHKIKKKAEQMACDEAIRQLSGF
jgi:dsRNA-specific ribonuclease